MTNQLITYRLPIDYSLMSLMSSISYVWYISSFSIGKCRKYTITSVFLPAMILYFTEAGRIKQRVLCCRKFIIIFGSSYLRVIEQLLESRLQGVASGHGRNTASFPY